MMAQRFEARLLGGDPKPDGIETVVLRYFSELPSLPMATWTRTELAMAYGRERQPHFEVASP